MEEKIIHDLALQKIKARINNTDEWITMLKISTQLRIEGLRDLAKLTLRCRLDPSKKIDLATECGLEHWLLDAYTRFMRRKKAISVEEEEQLGWNTTAKLFRVRHRQLELSEYEYEDEDEDIKFDFQTVIASEFVNIIAFHKSPISFLRPELLTAADPGIIQRDEIYYLVDTTLSVNFFMIFLF